MLTRCGLVRIILIGYPEGRATGSGYRQQKFFIWGGRAAWAQFTGLFYLFSPFMLQLAWYDYGVGNVERWYDPLEFFANFETTYSFFFLFLFFFDGFYYVRSM